MIMERKGKRRRRRKQQFFCVSSKCSAATNDEMKLLIRKGNGRQVEDLWLLKVLLLFGSTLLFLSPVFAGKFAGKFGAQHVALSRATLVRREALTLS